MSASHCYDVVIVGAGASGLSCAATLRKQKVDLLVLEARDRIGGRVHSQKIQGHALPVELGAEFIHAASPLLLDLLKKTGHDFYDVEFEQLFLKNNRLVKQKDFWERFEKVLGLAKADRQKDRSMAEFIKAHHDKIPSDMRSVLIGYVEGFQAAQLDLIGEKAFAKSEKKKRDLNGTNDFRPLGAYTDVLKGLYEGSDLEKRISLNSAVTKIVQHQDKAEIHVRQKSGRIKIVFAKQVVLSVPLAVLRGQHEKSRIVLQPEMPEIFKATEHLQTGHVQRMLFIFKNRFWENLSDEEPVSFLRTGPENYFPTWWTLSPLRAPYLLAWQGGPKAFEMSHWSKDERREKALSTLSKLTKRSKSFLRDQIESVHTHDWSQDPFTMGAYTYTGVVRGKEIPRIPLCFKKFLWLTGEALAPGDGQGTVHGALEHGELVAKKILKTYRNL